MAGHAINSYQEFWPVYVLAHSKPLNRLLHFVGTVIATSMIGYFAAMQMWWYIPLGLIPGYGLAWTGHFFVEHNRPATFGHPVWSMFSDYRMVALMFVGRMGGEVDRARAAARGC